MKKNPEKYNQRNERKKDIEFSNKKKKSVRIGEIWRYYEGMNIGNEISKDEHHIRPCIVLRSSFGNELILVGPITSKVREKLRNTYVFNVKNHRKFGLNNCDVVVNQVKLIDRKRLSHKFSAKKMSQKQIEIILNLYITFLR